MYESKKQYRIEGTFGQERYVQGLFVEMRKVRHELFVFVKQ